MNNYMLDLLNIKDKNIKIGERSDIKTKNKEKIKVLYGSLSYNPEYCPKCGYINEVEKILLNGVIKYLLLKFPKFLIYVLNYI